MMEPIVFRLVSGMEKILPGTAPSVWECPALTLLSNQHAAFQMAWFSRTKTRFSLKIQSPDGGICRAFREILIPCTYPCREQRDDWYLLTQPGQVPDLLMPAEPEASVETVPGQWNALWFTVWGAEMTPGSHRICLTVTGSEGEIQGDFSVDVRILQQQLPPQTLYHTEWFYADCLADFYGVPVFSPEHWHSIDCFMRAAADCGVNMLLTPVFTPPLDTAEGGERTTVQLVDVLLEDGQYRFGFEKLHRWAELCRKNGITELEIAHLFTQWGARCAPKIMVWEKGQLRRKFGWDTPATGAYTRFLQAFLPALKAELCRMGMLEHTWFHISDEPGEEHRESYRAARDSVWAELQDCKVMDAMSSYTLYEQGIVRKPVVCEDRIEPFLSHRVPGLWTYYCSCQGDRVPNRFLSMPLARNRILGVLLYVWDLEGFLHWGFNFYNTYLSTAHVDPRCVTDAGGSLPSGDAFLVYPAPKGEAWGSVRSETLRQAVEDHRLLCMSQQRLGREKTLEIIENTACGPLRFDEYPRDPQFFARLHAALFEAMELDSDFRQTQ